jgi:hypothetical protein
VLQVAVDDSASVGCLTGALSDSNGGGSSCRGVRPRTTWKEWRLLCFNVKFLVVIVVG